MYLFVAIVINMLLRATMGAPKRVWQCASAQLHSITADALTALASFPEYRTAVKHHDGGMMDSAVVDLVRVTEVLSASVGSKSSLAVAANIKLASVYVTRGDIIAAEKVLAYNINGALITACIKIYIILGYTLPDSTGDIHWACLAQAAATCRLLRGDLKAAGQALAEAAQIHK